MVAGVRSDVVPPSEAPKDPQTRQRRAAPRQPPLLRAIPAHANQDSYVVVDDHGERENSHSLHQHAQQQQQHATPHVHGPDCGCAPTPADIPALTCGGRYLVRFLADRLDFGGAEAFVRRFGPHLIVRALHDGILHWQPPRHNHDGTVGVRGRYVLNPAIRNPAAFLRWTVAQYLGNARQ